MIDQFRLLFARRLAAVRLHHATVSDSGIRIKIRRHGAEVLVRVGNLYLRLQGALSECLRMEEWFDWEVAVGELQEHVVQPHPKRRGIAFPEIIGLTLGDVLDSDREWDQKKQALALAATSLQHLHQQRLTACKVVDWPMSHGDATCHNIVINLESANAQWIDFDMRHRTDIAPQIRHADDLRSLIWSSACFVAQCDYADLVTTICSYYGDFNVVRAMQIMTRRANFRSTFQLAQAPLETNAFQQLQQQICEETYAC